MPTTIKLKNSVTTTNAPSSLVQGEVAINITDKKVWVGNAATTPVQLLGDGGSASFTSIAFGAGTVSLPSITFTGDTNTGIYSPAADTIAFTEGGVESMRIDSSGNVLIGTATSLGSERLAILRSSAGEMIRWTDGTLGGYIGTSAAGTRLDSGVALTFGTGGNERMRIDSSGNVGIGTSSPSSKLEVSNSANSVTTITVRNANGGAAAVANVRFTNDTSIGEIGQLPTSYAGYGVLTADSTYIYAGNNRPIQLATDNNYIAFGTGTGAPERMRITSGGDLCLGQTTADGKMTSNAASAAQRSYHGGNLDANCNTDGVYYAFVNRARTTAFNFFAGQNTSGIDIIIYGNGNIENRNNSYAGISDIKLKENIVDATPKLADLMNVKVRNYNFKDDSQKQIGVIAQELETVFPAMVEETADRDAEGNTLETTTKSVKYSVFVPMLIKAIQEQQAMIEELKQEVALLKSK